jgi:hypothetical protein
MLEPSSLKRNLVLRFTKGGGAQETMKDALIVQKKNQDRWKEENFSISHAAFPSMCE